ncbi:CCHC-type domain-containing protein [Trichonephila inaurata madagascariensis]|uniref:CCHC-type domain-containing protein n=1 Tax=Trichonephila inaurata madagascariensis TaxID=2747483 RepID=A0A8X6IEK0_9ARAC|nr:CCHC-type domain-containing protein [Trichonephila inaurata madagascariensis]
MPEDQKISHLMKGMAGDLHQVLINSEVRIVDKFVTRSKRSNSRRIVKEEIEKVLPRIATCINDGPSDLESIIREEVQSNLTSLTQEKPAPSPYRTKRTGESSWRPWPRPRRENRPTQQGTGRKTDFWRTSDNVPICFHCGRPIT